MASKLIKSKKITVLENAAAHWTSGILSDVVVDGDRLSLSPIQQQTFTSSGTFTVPAGVTSVDVLVVAGGGGGGGADGSNHNGGGGGAGGLIWEEGFAVTPGAVIAVTVGDGGSGGAPGADGSNGSNSVFGSLVAIGGGGGGRGTASGDGINGGSGGGAGRGSTTPGRGTAGQGNDGGRSVSGTSSSIGGGGGGGAGAAGNAGTTSAGGDGGAGSDFSSIFGTDIGDSGWFAGGGGGARVEGNGGSGGQGGGGAGASGYGPGSNATANTGGGGGGAAGSGGYAGGDGGSGIVVVRWWKNNGYRVKSFSLAEITDAINSLVQWNATTPAGTSIDIYAAISANGATPPDSGWEKQTSGQPLTVIEEGENYAGKYLWIKQVLETTAPEETPLLNSFQFVINSRYVQATQGDSLVVGFSEASDLPSFKRSFDQLMVFVAEEDIDIQVVFKTMDQLKLAFAERSQLNNIHSAMNALNRRIYGRVEITYTDPFMDESIDATATETGRHSSPAAVADNIVAPLYKWFSLHRNKLDGSYHPMPGSDPGRVGWWGETLSDANGEFADPPMLTLVFDPRLVQELRLVGDAMLQEFPVDFEISLYDPENNLLHLETVTGNTEADWRKSVSFESVAKMELEIRRINRPGSVVKVLECFTAVIETYEGEDIISMNLVEEREPQGATIPIGNISANELTVRLNNLDRRFDPGNPDSRLRGLLKKNRRMRAWLGAEIEPGLVEWYPLGVFWTQNWSTPENELWAETYGWDRLEFLRNTDFSVSQVYQNISLGELADLVLQDAGLRPEEYRIDPELYTIIVPYAWFDRMSHRRALELIAAAALGQVYCDREGIIVVEVFRPSPVSKFEFNADNIFNKDHPLDWGKLINYVEVRATPRVPGPEEVVYQDTEAFTVPAGEKITRTHIFNFTPVVDVQEPVITAGPEIQVKEYTAYAWGMEAVYENVGLTDQEVESIEIRGKKLEPAGGKIAIAQDPISIRDNGKQALSEPITSEFIQTQERAQQIADTLLAAYKDPRRDITLDARGNIALRLGDRITAPDYRDQIKGDYYILRQELTFDGGLRARIDAQKIAEEE